MACLRASRRYGLNDLKWQAHGMSPDGLTHPKPDLGCQTLLSSSGTPSHACIKPNRSFSWCPEVYLCSPGICQAPVGSIEHEEHDGCRAAQAAQLQVGDGQPGLCGVQPEHCRCEECQQVRSCQFKVAHQASCESGSGSCSASAEGQNRCACFTGSGQHESAMQVLWVQVPHQNGRAREQHSRAPQPRRGR